MRGPESSSVWRRMETNHLAVESISASRENITAALTPKELVVEIKPKSVFT